MAVPPLLHPTTGKALWAQVPVLPVSPWRAEVTAAFQAGIDALQDGVDVDTAEKDLHAIAARFDDRSLHQWVATELLRRLWRLFDDQDVVDATLRNALTAANGQVVAQASERAVAERSSRPASGGSHEVRSQQSEPAKAPASAAERRGNPPDSLPFSAADAPALFTLTAARPGSWANHLHVWVDRQGITDAKVAALGEAGLTTADFFNLYVVLRDGRSRFSPSETHALVTFKKSSARSLQRVLQAKSAMVAWSAASEPATPPEGAGGVVVTVAVDSE